MKRSFLLLFATLLAVAAPLAPAHADDSVPVDFFYDALSPYGDWVYTPNYGYVWQPLAAQQPGWAPYTDGNWVYTDAGWTWMTNEDFGWVTYHYGRWIRLGPNWFWVPGNEWAPAWVSWRQTQGQIGWAPLPPEAVWAPDIGFGSWTDSYYDVGPSYYNFVPFTAFASAASLRPFIMDRSRNFTFYQQSVNITHTNYQQNAVSHVFVGGPDPQRIDRFGGHQVRRLTLRRDDEGFRRDWQEHRQGGAFPRNLGGHSRIERDQLIVAAPSIRREASHALPSRVREALQQPEVDRGWRGGPDAQGIKELRQQQHDELARMKPSNLPNKKVQPATSTAPPPAFGRVLEPHERFGNGGSTPAGRGTPREEGRPGKMAPGIPDKQNKDSDRRGDGPPGVPDRQKEERGRRGDGPPGMPQRDPRGEGPKPGQRPDDNKGTPAGDSPRKRPADAPPTAAPRGQPQPPTAEPPRRSETPKVSPPPSQKTPDMPNRPRGVPGGQPRQEPRRSPADHPPGQPPNTRPSPPSPQPAARPSPPQQRPQPAARPSPPPQRPQPAPPAARPSPPPQRPQPAQAAPAQPPPGNPRPNGKRR